MRGITITYQYKGEDAPWRKAIETFITAIENDPRIAGRFTYQVATADDRETRIHWGRWDSQETLSHLQAQGYFKEFSGKVREFAGDTLKPTPHDITLKSAGW